MCQIWSRKKGRPRSLSRPPALTLRPGHGATVAAARASISAGTRDSPSGLWRQAQAGFGLVTRSVSPTRVGHGCGRRTTITVGGDSRGPGPDLSGQCHGTVPVT